MEAVLVLSANEVASFHRIYKGSEIVWFEQKALGEMLKSNEGFKSRYGDPPQHDVVKNDPQLRAFIRAQFVLCLADSLESSTYGAVYVDSIRHEVVTDFQLDQMNKKTLTEHCKRSNISIAVCEAVYTRMGTLKKRMTKLADDTIDAWELEGAPKKEKELDTPEVMRKKNEDRLREITSPRVSSPDAMSELTDIAGNLNLRPLEDCRAAPRVLETEEDFSSSAIHIPRPPRIQNQKIKHKHSPEDPFYTPRGAVVALLNVVGEHIKKEYTDTGLPIFEPACEDGAITKVLRESSLEVIEQDLFSERVAEKVDYLGKKVDPGYSVLITNPPYSLKFEFWEKACKAGKPFAFLLPILCLFTVRGSALFEAYPVDVYGFRRNVVFDHRGRKTAYSGMAWIVRNLGDQWGHSTFKYADTREVTETDTDSFADHADVGFVIEGLEIIEV